MPVPIRITIGEVVLEAELNDSPTARAVAKELPFTFSGNTWGDEIYGTIPVKREAVKPVDIIQEKGTLAYWPIGNALCIFWGPTPVSQGGEIRPASPVDVVGKVTAGLEKLILKQPDPGKIHVERT